MKNINFIFSTFFLMMIGIVANSQTAIWNGSSSTHWDDAANWTFTGGGSLTNVATVYTIPGSPDGPLTAMGAALQMQQLTIQVGGTGTLPVGFTLTIDGSSGNGLHNYGTFTTEGNLTIQNNTDSGIRNENLFNHNTGVIAIDDTGINGITNTGNGSFANNAVINIGHTGGEDNINGSGIESLVPFSNSGTIDVRNTASHGIKVLNSTFDNFGTILTNNTNPFFEIALRLGFDGNVATFNNKPGATFNFSGYSVGFDSATNCPLNNEGTLTFGALDRYAVDCLGPVYNSGLIQGYGDFYFYGNSTLGGTLSPGLSIGTMLMEEYQEFDATTILQIEVDGSNASDYDQFNSTPDLQISGTLAASINYSPGSNDRIVFLSAATVSGTFGTIDPPLPTDWALDYSVVGEVALVYSGILPVELVSFSAKKEQEAVVLKWQTASETNNEGFEVGHSTAGRDWEYLGFVAGYGNSASAHDYFFTHENPSNGINYYRLRQTDFDGQYDYSDIRSVEFAGTDEQLRVFPNPAGSRANIQFPGGFEEASLLVTDMGGQIVFEQKLEAGRPLQSINVKAWPTGSYLVQVQVDGKVAAQRLQINTN